MTTISVIDGSPRQGRFYEKPSRRILQYLQKRDGIEARLLDLRDHQGGDVDKGLAELEKDAQTMIDDLLWWTTALKAARKEN